MTRRGKRWLEQVLFSSRWLMTPIYLGLVSALVLILIKFAEKLAADWRSVWSDTSSDLILSVLALIDLSLAANLVLMVIFAGYESFVAKIETVEGDDKPDWMGKIDFAGLKLKLIASMIAISGIHLLEIFMNIEHYEPSRIYQSIGLTSNLRYFRFDLGSDRFHCRQNTGSFLTCSQAQHEFANAQKFLGSRKCCMGRGGPLSKPQAERGKRLGTPNATTS